MRNTLGALGGLMDESELLLRFARLRDDLRPVPIVGPSGQPLPVDWVAVSRAWTGYPGTAPKESFILYLLTDAGDISELLQFDTLEIALDQAHAILGVDSSEWRPCHVEIDGECIPWSLVG